jgi:hypothetical protein
MSKYQGNDPDEAKLHIRYWLDAIEDCSRGKRYDKTLMKWAIIERQSLQLWCERHKIPLPEFWFPPGWGIDYEWPDDTPEEIKTLIPGESSEEQKVRIDERHRTQMACQQIGLKLWAKNPQLTNKEISLSDEVQQLGGGSEYEPETVHGWLSEVDPRSPSKKRGRKRKNNSGSGNSAPPQLPEK